MGFEINPYDKCISNKIINGNQCTIGWYVDGNKISHKEVKVFDDMLTIFKENWVPNNNAREFTQFSWNGYENNEREYSRDCYERTN